MMPQTNAETGFESLVGQIADEFTDRLQRGEQPDIEEYTRQLPEQAKIVRQVLASVMALHTSLIGSPVPQAEMESQSLHGDSTNPHSSDDPLRTRNSPRCNTTLPHVTHGDLTIALDDYEIQEEIGRGGMGVVVKARHKALDRVVALKILPAGAKPEELARFRNEARLVAKLNHPSIVQIFDVGETAGQPYYAMEYVSGGSLAARLQGQPQPPHAAAEFVEVIAQAMQTAHDHGLIHRDLKPANVLIADCGLRIAECKANKPDEKPASLNQSAIPNSQSAIPKITDFGLAKNLDDDSAQTKTGAIVGTPSYMAPEQTMGSRGTVGPAADIYALGAILYELLTGRPPFRGATVLETLEQVREADPVPLRQLVASCPRDLETICRTCLHKDPWRRYDSAQALVNDLQAFRTGRPIQARPVTQAERVWKWLRRHPALAACGLLVLVSGFALVVAVMRANHNRELEGANDQLQHAVGQTRQALGEAKVAQHEAEIARGVAADALQRERAFLYAHSVRLAYREWLANEVPRARKLLQECPEDLRGWEWRYLDRLCNSEELILAVHPAPVACIAFSPDGERLASACGTSEVFKGWKGLQLRIWNAKTGQVLHTLKGHTAGVAAVTFSPDGKRLASAAADKSVRVWDVDTGRVLYELTHPTGAAAVVFGPDGTWLATACRDKFVRFWDMATGKETKTLEQSAPVHALTVSADGRQLMCGEGVKIAVWDLDENRRLLTLEGHTLSVRGVALSPDGRHLLSTSAVAPKAGAPIAARTAPASEFAEIKLWNLATGKELSLPGPDVKMTSMCGAYSPDGRILVHAADRMIAVRDARTHEVLFELRGHGDEVAALSFTRDGHRLASAGAAGAVRVWNLRQPRETHDFSAMAGASDVAFSRDSKHLAIAGRAATGIGPTGLSPAAVVWEVGTDKARRVAASAVGRPANLTDIKGLMSLSRIECAVPDPSGKDEAAKWRKELEKSKE